MLNNKDSLYSIEIEDIKVGSAYIEPKTGLSFCITEISIHNRATGNYSFPGKKAKQFRELNPGFVLSLKYKTAQYHLYLKEMDYSTKTYTLFIKEQ